MPGISLAFTEFKDTYTILVGAEGKRLEENIRKGSQFNNRCILPPPPHKITPYVPDGFTGNCVELADTIFSKENCDAHLAVTLQAAIELGGREVFLIGFDGYTATELNEREAFFMQENQLIFDHFIQHSRKHIQLKSLSPYCLRKHCGFFYLCLDKMKYLIVIPARLKSTRLPNKPLIKIQGKEILLRTYERCLLAVDTIPKKS